MCGVVAGEWDIRAWSTIAAVSRTWEENRARLEAYRDAHKGCCNVPRGWKDDPQLGNWVSTQKAQFRKYEEDPATSTLSAERFSALQQMGATSSWLAASLIRSVDTRTWEESLSLIHI